MDTLHFFEPGSVITDLRSIDKYDALRELVRRAPVFGGMRDRRGFEEAVVAREKLQTTGLGRGVAVAHGRIEGLRRVLISLGISPDGISFDSPDDAPVKLMFVIASPPRMSLEYLHALSTLVRCVHQEHIRDSLLRAGSAAEAEDLLRRVFHAESARCAASAT